MSGIISRILEGDGLFERLGEFFTKGKLLTLLVLFAFLCVVSVVGLCYTHTTPLEEKHKTVLASYRHEGLYDYTAHLGPNLIYDNKSTLQANGKELYTKVVENIEIEFGYSFDSNPFENVRTDYSISSVLKAPGKWEKRVTGMVARPSQVEGGEVSTEFTVDVPWIWSYAENIMEETEASASSYDLMIKPEIHTIAETGVGTVNEIFVPALTLSFRTGEKGSRIVMEGLENAKTGTIQHTETVENPGVEARRTLFYLLTVVAFGGLIPVGLYYGVTRPKTEKKVEDIIEPYQDIILEADDRPKTGRDITTVSIGSLEEIVEIAEGLGKPILHLASTEEEPGEKIHVFYVLDESVEYKYRYEP